MPRSKEYIEKTCLICGNSFIVNNKNKRECNRKTCSKKCCNKLVSLNSKTKAQCSVCGVGIITSKSAISSNNDVYCNKCKNLRYLKICKQCGNEFRCSHNTTFLCSNVCKIEHNKNDKIEVVCSYCHKSYKQAKFNLYSGKNNFCSQTCNSNFYATNNRNRYGKTWYRWNKQIKRRDNYQCLICKVTSNLEVHHFTKLTQFNNPDDAHYNDNLGTFCASCHKLVEKLNYKNLSEFNERYSPNS